MKQDSTHTVKMEQQGERSSSLIGDHPQVFQVDGNVYYQVSTPEACRHPLFPLAPIPEAGIFIDRKEYIEVVERFFLRGPEKFLLLDGIGGIGKTAFAAYVCRMFQDVFQDIYWSNCTSEEGTEERIFGELYSLFARNNDHLMEGAWNTTCLPLESWLHSLVQKLKAQRYLLIFDNVHAILDRSGQIKFPGLMLLFQELLQSSHQSKILLLSRRRFNFPRQPSGVMVKKRMNGLNTQFTQIFLKRLNMPLSIEETRTLHQKVGGHPLALRVLADLYHRGLSLEKLLTIPFRHLSRESKELFDELFSQLWHMMRPDEIRVLQGLSTYRIPVPFQALQDFHETDDEDDEEGLLCIQEIVNALAEKCFLEIQADESRQLFYSVPGLIQEFVFRSIAPKQCRFYHQQAARYWIMVEKTENPMAYQSLQAAEEAIYHLLHADQKEVATNLSLSLSERLCRCGLYNMAQSMLLKTLDGALSEEDLAARCNNLGHVYMCQGDYIQASEYYEQAREIYEELNMPDGLAVSYNNIGTVCASQGEYSQALHYYKQSKDLLRQLSLRRELATAYNNLGFLYASVGDYLLSLSYHERARKIQEELGLEADVANTYNNLGFIYDSQREYLLALEYYEKALNIREHLGVEADLAESYNNIGGVYAAQENFERALSYFQHARDILERLGLEVNLARCYNNIGLVYTTQGNHEVALGYYEKAREIQERLGLEVDLGRTYTNMGVVYASWNSSGSMIQALWYYEKAREIQEHLGLEAHLAITFGNMGQMYYEQGDYVRAEHALCLTVDIRKRIKHPDWESDLALLEQIRHKLRKSNDRFRILLKKITGKGG